MLKETSLWKISTLKSRKGKIAFPEYQREPTLWTLAAKQRLVDSIMRDFDISSIYLYRHEDDRWDCVDGRQRIGAIHSFLNDNPDDDRDEGFRYKVMNEIFNDEAHPFVTLHDKTYEDICELAESGNQIAKDFRDKVTGYEVTVVELFDSKVAQEFNLQFTRLNLGQLIISGEKLHAMIGDLRDYCFGELGAHKFLSKTNIPTRRYAREQLAAQIVAQVFAIEESKRDKGQREFTRVRHIDLQRQFKLHADLGSEEDSWIRRVRDILDLLANQLEILPPLRSRSIVLSLVLLAYERGIDNDEEAQELATFAKFFLDALKRQVSLGLDAEDEYRYLNDFQRYLTQASVEKYSVAARAKELEESFDYWLKEGRLKGDRVNPEKPRDEVS